MSHATLRQAAAGCGLVLALVLPQPVSTEESREVPIWVDVELETPTPGLGDPLGALKIPPGVPVKIRGVAALTLAGETLEIIVTPPQEPEPLDPGEPPSEFDEDKCVSAIYLGASRFEPPARLDVIVGNDGVFQTRYMPNAIGEHEVLVRDRSAGHEGESSFAVEDPNELSEQIHEELEKEAKQIVESVNKLAGALRGKLLELPRSPAQEEALRRAEALNELVERKLPPGKAPAWIDSVQYLMHLRNTAGEMCPATSELVTRLDVWKQQTAKANAEAQQALIDVTRGKVMCDQLDALVRGLEALGFYAALADDPDRVFENWTSRNPAARLVAMIPGPKRTVAVSEAVARAREGMANPGPAAEGVPQSAADLAQYLSSQSLERYCQVFRGPLSGTMAAEFLHDGKQWWRYDFSIEGELVLRYPKNVRGDSIPLSGELRGHATAFSSWDNAIPVLFPELAQGTVFRSVRSEPRAPAFFRVPVQGEVSKDTLRVELLGATTDFEGQNASVLTIMLPVLSMRIQVSEYDLPYKGARFMMGRAMDDAPAEFTIRRDGASMVVERSFQRTRNAGDSRGTYNLKLKACNPGCSASDSHEVEPTRM